MANKKITELPAATTPLDGTEKVEIVQAGINKQVDSSELGGGGGSGTVESVTGDGVDNTDPDNPVLTFPVASEVVFTPGGTIAATDVQEAIEELDTELNAAVDLKVDTLFTFRTETASHTLDSTDLASINAGQMLEIVMNVASANSVTIPLNATQAFPVGTCLVVSQLGAGQTSIVATGGVTMNSANGWVKIAYQHASVVLTKTATNTWSVKGTLSA